VKKKPPEKQPCHQCRHSYAGVICPLCKTERREYTQLKARKNPRVASQFSAAQKLLKSFAGVGEIEHVKMPDLNVSGPVVGIGKLSGIMYVALHDGVEMEYIHRFKPSARPLLAVTHDGKQLLLLGGAYRVTSKGVEDRG
jgi:hypothetical protein